MLLAACTYGLSPPNREPITKTGDGFYTIRVIHDTAGEKSNSEDIAMLRAAKVARVQGYAYCAVLYGGTVRHDVTDSMPGFVAVTLIGPVYIPPRRATSAEPYTHTELHIQLLKDPPQRCQFILV